MEILTGITEYAERHLTDDDIENLKSMIGCEAVESDRVSCIDGGRYYILPDGEETHEIFLILKSDTNP